MDVLDNVNYEINFMNMQVSPISMYPKGVDILTFN